jgi:hypothetical protein
VLNKVLILRKASGHIIFVGCLFTVDIKACMSSALCD